MTPVNVKLATLVLAMAVLAGCGGGSDEPAKPTATPRVYTFEEMKAALPTAEDVDGGLKIRSTCPEDKDVCADPEPGNASVNISLKASMPELTEQQDDVGVNQVHVEISAHADETAAKSQQAKSRKHWKKYDGLYNTPHKDLGDGNYTPWEKGRGDFGDAASGRFKGYRVDRASTAETMGKFFSTTIDVRNGSARIEVTAFLGVEGRKITDVEELADQVLADYLKRLG